MITLVVNEDSAVIAQVKKQLLKLVDVIDIQDLTGEDSYKRELILLTMETQGDDLVKKEIASKVNEFQAKIIEGSSQTLMIEFLGAPERVSSLLKELSQYKVISIARTGSIALRYK